MWKKIKYLIDNLSTKDDEEKTIMGRRAFLFTLPALVTVPKMITPFKVGIAPFEYKQTIGYDVGSPSSFSACVVQYKGGFSPDLEEYQEFLVRTIAKAFDVPPFKIKTRSMGASAQAFEQLRAEQFEKAVKRVIDENPCLKSSLIVKSRYKRD
jgi:hypothetical protein